MMAADDSHLPADQRAPFEPPNERLDGKALPSEDYEAQLMWRLRYRIARAQLGQLFRESRLRTTLVVCLSATFWLGLFVLFYCGFDFLVLYVGGAGAMAHAQPVRLIFHVFFASLNLMLIFSAGIILYGGLFSSAETRFLLTQPIRTERIVLHKFQEAVLFSSWGFLLLATPMTVAYGIVVGAPWYYFALILPLLLSFVYIPCGIGAFLCLLIVYKLPNLRTTLVASVAVAMIAIAGWSIWQTVVSPRAQLFGAEWFQATVRRFAITEQEWLPSTWLSNSLLEGALPWPVEGASATDLPVVQSCLYLVLMASNALLCHFVTLWAGRRWFRAAHCGLECRVRKRRLAKEAPIDRLARALLWPFPNQVKLLLLKDWRLLRRDPVQWSQFLIFFGLLGLYFLNIDRFSNPGDDLNYMTWVNMVSFLNLAVVGLILSTFTTRFIYPMISLEGRRFWVLGLMPIRRDTIVWSKFVFAAIGSLTPCATLVLLSDLMLRVSPLVVVVHQLTNVLLCLGLAAMAVGLGAAMPNFHEPSPSKIAAGFGGTLNLVLSALYIIAIVVLAALPCHFLLITTSHRAAEGILDPEYLRTWLVIGAAAAILIGAAATILPLRSGIKAFNQLEFY